MFGPAQRLHGATFVVDLELQRPELDADGIVADIGLRQRAAEVGPGAAQLPQPRRAGGASRAATPRPRCWRGRSRCASAARIQDGALGEEAKGALAALKVTLRESHVAWASYETRLRPDERCVQLVVPGPLDQRTGGYIYDRRIVEGLRALGWTVAGARARRALPAGRRGGARARRAEALAAMPPGACR